MLVFVKNNILVRSKSIYDFDEQDITSRRGFELINSSRSLPSNWQGLISWLDVQETLELHDDEELIGLRELWHIHGDRVFALAGGALQFAEWFRDVKLCSFCGSSLRPSTSDYGRVCESCGRVFYAPLSPAVIVAVERDGKLLLAHNTAWGNNRHSVIAGFVEPGETLEDTVRREIFEEVRVRVGNIRYFGSQAWPFPHSLMLGFTASYESGEVEPDGVEIGSAGFYSSAEILRMNIPDKASIARRLIDNFLETHRENIL